MNHQAEHSESFLETMLKGLINKPLEAISGALAVSLATAWNFWADRIFDALLNTLGGKWILALLFALLVLSIYGISGFCIQKKRIPWFERLIPVPGAGYSRDPKNGEFVCPRCASADRKAYLAQISDGAFYCHSCGNATKRLKANE